MTRTVLTGLLTLFVAGCVPSVQQPEVRLVGARLASIGMTGGVVDVRLSVYNPNRFALRATGLTYDVDLEQPGGDGWLDFTEGTLDRRIEVPSGDSTVVVIPVEFEYRGIGQALQSLMDRGTFEYRVSGVVALEGPIQRDFPYRHSGAVTPSGVR